MDRKHAVEKQALTLVERHVNMSNDLTQAAHNLTLGEKRVVMSCVAQLDSLRMESGRYKIKLTALEFAAAFGVDPATAYAQLKDVADRLYERTVVREQATRKGPKISRYRWVSGITYHKGEGWIELGFSHEITPHLVALRGNFTSYKLTQATALRSVYSWRLLEMLMQFKGTGLLRISVDDFCHAMSAPPSYRANFKELRTRIIDAAVKELTAKDGWVIDWNGTKPGGRKITGLEFRFHKDPQASLL